MLCSSKSIFQILISGPPWISLRMRCHFSIYTFLSREADPYSNRRYIRRHWCTFICHVLILRLARIHLHIHCFCVDGFLCLAGDLRPIILRMNLPLETSKFRIRSLFPTSILLRKLIHCSITTFLHHVSFHSKIIPCTFHRCFVSSLTFSHHFRRHLQRFLLVKLPMLYHF